MERFAVRSDDDFSSYGEGHIFSLLLPIWGGRFLCGCYLWKNYRTKSGETAERKSEKLPNEIRKNTERALCRFAICDKIRRK